MDARKELENPAQPRKGRLKPSPIGLRRPERIDGEDMEPVIGDVRMGAEVQGDASQE